VGGAPELLCHLDRVGGLDHAGRGRQFHGPDQGAERGPGVRGDLVVLVLMLVRAGLLEHERVEVRIRERELPVPQAAVPQPREHVRLAARLDRRVQPVEPLDQQRVDQAVLAAEPVVDAHRGDAGLRRDRAHRQPAWTLPDQHGLGG
jgi:hypothetical protein